MLQRKEQNRIKCNTMQSTMWTTTRNGSRTKTKTKTETGSVNVHLQKKALSNRPSLWFGCVVPTAPFVLLLVFVVPFLKLVLEPSDRNARFRMIERIVPFFSPPTSPPTASGWVFVLSLCNGDQSHVR